MTIDPLPDALEPGFQCVRTHWIRGFMAFRLTRPGPGAGTGRTHDSMSA
jgi:hypothetical protein